MAETLTELVAKITTDATGLKQGLSEGEKATEVSSKRMADSLKKVGAAMAASGAAITAALGLMGKAAIDEEINIKRLATTINNSGTAYDSVKDSLEAVIAATQRKTGIADNDQRDILGRLVLITQDYDKALSLLPTVLDLAAVGEMDATTAATYLGKAFLDLEDGAEEVTVRFGQASLQFKSMEDIQNRVAGAAENLANPLSVLKASIGDVAEVIGAKLIPLVKGTIDKIVDITIKIQGWIKEHPKLAKTLTLVSLALGAILTVVGGLILAMPVITSLVAAFGVVFHVALGPIGLISLAIMGLIAAGILLWQNWDKVSKFLANSWDNIKIAFATAVKWIVSTVLLPFITMVGLEIGGLLKGIGKVVGVFNKDLGNAIEGVADKFLHAKDTITDWADNLADSAKASKEFRKTEEDIKKLTETIKAEFAEQTSEIQANYDKQRSESRKAYDAAVEAINKEYGIGEAAKEVSETKIEAARRATQALKDSYEREKDAAKDRYNSEMSHIQDIRDAKLAALNIETDATVKALQDQIDAIDNQTSREELAITRGEEANRLAELEGAFDSAKTAESKAKAKEEWDKYTTQVARNELIRTRAEEKDALRDQIGEARELAKNRKTQIQEETDFDLANLKIKYDAEILNYTNLATAADTDLANSLVRIETDRLAKITAQKEILDETLADIKIAEEADITALAKQLERANTQVKEINLAYDALQKRYDIEIVTRHIDEYGKGVQATEGLPGAIIAAQHGAIISSPTLTLMGEQAPSIREAIIPETMWGEIGGKSNIIVQFTQPVFFDREDTMNRFVDMISKGIDRKQRLRFGGAYSG